MAREAAIVSTARTGVGKAYRGAFNDTEAPVLAAHVVNAAIERAGIDPARVDDVYLGVGNHWNTQSYNLGRLAVHGSVLPDSTGGFTLDRKCSSGLNALALAARGIMCNEIDVAVAGGMESISLTLNKHAPQFRNRSDFIKAADLHAYMAMIETAARRRMRSPRPASSARARRRPRESSPTKSCRSPFKKRCSTRRAMRPARKK